MGEHGISTSRILFDASSQDWRVNFFRALFIRLFWDAGWRVPKAISGFSLTSF